MTKSRDTIALERALQIASEDPLRRAQLEDMLKDRDWFDVASFAACCCQSQALNLKPWQDPPAFADSHDDRQAQALLKRMLAAGVSRFEPDPLVALAKSTQAD